MGSDHGATRWVPAVVPYGEHHREGFLSSSEDGRVHRLTGRCRDFLHPGLQQRILEGRDCQGGQR